MKPLVIIEYCPRCGWLLRAAYMAQEILTTFVNELQGVQLQPSETSGNYLVTLNGELIFDRRKEGRFPEAKELKQLIRDRVAPGKDLGHSDRKSSAAET